MTHYPRLPAARAAEAAVLLFRVYADGNYWTAAGWKNDAVPDFDEGACRGEGGGFDDARGRGESAGTETASARQAVQPKEDHARDGPVCRPRRHAKAAQPRRARAVSRSVYHRALTTRLR